MKNQRYQYILFDLDGTLTDSMPGIINSLKYAFQQMSLPEPSLEILKKFVGPPLAESFEKYCHLSPQEIADAKELADFLM